MCGIVGVASVRSQEESDWLPRASACLGHRGPDGADEWWSLDRRVGLAHRRLAVVDLTPSGNQPMCLAGSTLTITFNGEIYNHMELRAWAESAGHRSWRGNSDTESLLTCIHLFGLEPTLRRAAGMFALALYDGRARRLTLVRDRVGEKPLFYRLSDGALWFASELKALLSNRALPRRVSRQSLDCYLAFGYVPGSLCILEGYAKLPAAHYLEFDIDTGVSRLNRYWHLPALVPSRCLASKPDALLNELEVLISDSVALQLRADVPVGVTLSGGVDSSVIAALAVRHVRTVRAFSVGFGGHGRFDETPHARMVADHLGLDHCVLEASPASADVVPLLAVQFDEPMADSSMIPTYLVSKLIRQHCTVALGGDGGDELFGGYGYYCRWLQMERVARLIPGFMRRAFSNMSWMMPVGVRGRPLVSGMGYDLDTALPRSAPLFDATSRVRLLPSSAQVRGFAEGALEDQIPEGLDLLQRATRTDFMTYLPDDILVKVDRTSMLNSLEVRSPLLDHRVVEFAFGRVSSSLKATRDAKKILLKKLAKRLLPRQFDLQRKQGFSIPLSAWLKGGAFRDLFRDVLLQTGVPFDRGFVRSLLNGQDRGRSNAERLFALVQLELWRRHYSVDLD